MRYRVDFKNGGYASFDEDDLDKAEEAFDQKGIRMRVCRDIHDEGLVVKGAPIVEDLTAEPWKAN